MNVISTHLPAECTSSQLDLLAETESLSSHISQFLYVSSEYRGTMTIQVLIFPMQGRCSL
jgi:hypothetical protein